MLKSFEKKKKTPNCFPLKKKKQTFPKNLNNFWYIFYCSLSTY
jgi:hypothetical protein